MAGDQYKIFDQNACYFLTATVIHWIDVFSRREYKDIIVESLDYCIKNKGLELYAWVIMSNHIHLVARINTPHKMSDFLRDFKKFTSKKILDSIQKIPESRREWLLDKFSFEAKRTQRANEYKFWKDGNHAIYMEDIDLMQKVDYVHNNPVKAGIVIEPEHYIYSSAIDYAGGSGLVKVVVV